MSARICHYRRTLYYALYTRQLGANRGVSLGSATSKKYSGIRLKHAASALLQPRIYFILTALLSPDHKHFCTILDSELPPSVEAFSRYIYGWRSRINIKITDWRFELVIRDRT